jgi:hypothetical protein
MKMTNKILLKPDKLTKKKSVPLHAMVGLGGEKI